MNLPFAYVTFSVFALSSGGTIAWGQVDRPKPAFLNGIGIDQHMGNRVPLDAVFSDENGRPVHLAQFFDGTRKPVILTLVYFNCPFVCTAELNDLNRGMNGIPLSAGDDFEVVSISFDPREGPDIAKDKKEQFMRSYRREHAAAGWHFLTGQDPSIKAVADSIGFHYRKDENHDNQWLHPGGIVILTPQGRVSRYFFQTDFDLKDLRLALEEASGNKIGSFSDQLLTYCFHYDPTSGKYSLYITRFLQLGGVLTLGGLGAFFLAIYFRDSASRSQMTSDDPPKQV